MFIVIFRVTIILFRSKLFWSSHVAIFYINLISLHKHISVGYEKIIIIIIIIIQKEKRPDRHSNINVVYRYYHNRYPFKTWMF